MARGAARKLLSGAVPRRVLLAIGLAATAVGGFYFARFGEAMLLMSSVVGSDSISEDVASNARGDVARVTTEGSGRWREPDETVVRLRPAHHWFWTTLVSIKSFGVRESLVWKNANTLDVALDFGCLMQVTRPTDEIGLIHISYHLADHDKTLAKGCPD